MATFYYNDGKEVECDDLHRVFKAGVLEMETHMWMERYTVL